MLTSSSNQYLRPEYLTPLPTTLDAKKSPLALLAQTCSQIGADPTPNPVNGSTKSLLNNTSTQNNSHEPSSTASQPKSKSSSNSNSTTNGSSSAKAHHDHPDHHRARKLSQTVSPHIPEKAVKKHESDSTPVPASSTRLSPPTSNCSNSISVTTSDDKATPPTPNSKTTSPNPTNNSPPANPNPTNKSPSADSVPASSKPADPTISTSKLNLSGSHGAGPLTFSTASSLDLALKHGLPFPGLYPPLPPVTSSGTGIPPYLHSYARLKAAAASNGGSAGPDPLLSIACRDPFCAGCQGGQHGLSFGLKSCPAGCLQCDHHKSPLSGGPYGLPFLPGFGLPASLASLYSNPSSSLSLHTPYVCNWFVGETYCGKRFSSSDDLLQHLRSHTSLSGTPTSNQEAVQSLAAAAAAAGYPPSHHHPLLSSSHGLLSRTYPTPPLSPLSSARFHPYSKPNGGGSNGLSGPLSLSSSSPALNSGLFPPGFPGLGHPAFSPYYPYSFYGQRLGGGTGSLHP